MASLASAFERYTNWIVLILFLFSVNLTMEAGAYLLDEGAGDRLRAWAQWPARAGLVLLVVAMILARPLKQRRREAGRRAFQDDFVTDALKRSASIAFLTTLCFVAFLDGAANHTDLPADFFIKLPGISLTAVFSLCYFALSFVAGRSNDHEPAA
ncbi:MAG: hypothetical protein GC160_28105 [Acidobacteria bacterium]|nr:hypothetical protein [Acidobacteriota bacterium]